MALRDLLVRIRGDNKDLKNKIKDSNKSVDGFSKSVKGLGKALGAAFAIKQIASFAKRSAEAYDQQVKAEKSLLVALGGRESVQKNLIRQAGELQRTTLFGDEETIKAQALIAAFVKEEEQIKKVIPLVQDLAAAKGMDLAAAADLVGKTLGSTTNAMSRYGIEVTGAVGSSERLETLTKNLDKAFGGQAKAAAEVGTGAITQLKNAFGDLTETIGETVTNVVTALVPALMKLVDGLQLVFKGVRKLKEEQWDESTRKAVEADRDEVQKLAKRYLELGVAQDKQSAEQKAINSLLVQYSQVLGYVAGIDKEREEQVKVQIEQLKSYRTELKKVNDEATKIVSSDKITSELDKKLTHANKLFEHRGGQKQLQTSDFIDWDDEFTKGIEEDLDNITVSTSILGEEAQKVGDSTGSVFEEMGNMAQMALDSMVNALGSFASSAGRAIAMNEGLGDSFADLGVAIMDALGGILIMAGLQAISAGAIPVGLALIAGGLLAKGLSGLISGSNQAQQPGQVAYQANAYDRNGSMIYGNDIRTAYDYSTRTNNKVG